MFDILGAVTNGGANAACVRVSDPLALTLTFITASLTNPPGGWFTAPVYSSWHF
jgi:hypothetical protein